MKSKHPHNRSEYVAPSTSCVSLSHEWAFLTGSQPDSRSHTPEGYDVDNDVYSW